VDSPLALNATEVYRMHPECFDAEATELLHETGDLLGCGECTYVRSVAESKALHRRRKPCTIISASGMCEAGRIRHHLKNNIANAKNTILVPGFQAEGTLGRRLVEGAEKVNIFHKGYRVRAEVVQINGFSAHADRRELDGLLTPIAKRVKRAFLVHGEPDQSAALAELMRERGFADVTAAQRGQRVTLSPA
jgi:metallo-beta-lactamase family protein